VAIEKAKVSLEGLEIGHPFRVSAFIFSSPWPWARDKRVQPKKNPNVWKKCSICYERGTPRIGASGTYLHFCRQVVNNTVELGYSALGHSVIRNMYFGSFSPLLTVLLTDTCTQWRQVTTCPKVTSSPSPTYTYVIYDIIADDMCTPCWPTCTSLKIDIIPTYAKINPMYSQNKVSEFLRIFPCWLRVTLLMNWKILATTTSNYDQQVLSQSVVLVRCHLLHEFFTYLLNWLIFFVT